ncbi:MAG: type I polyketide synthase [Desulfuromonadales bacterium]
MSDLKMYQEALKKASSTIELLISENDRLKNKEPIAIIGMGCRLPGGANSPEEYWSLLSEGRDAITVIPADRWDAERYFDENTEVPGKMYVREGGFLDHSPYDFDTRFFGISPKEAKALDPQQRLLLEVVWEAVEDAGINPVSLQGSRTGVFIGISSNDYDSAHLRSGDLSLIDPYSLTGFTFSTAAGRISYTLGLEGPSFPIDTACSSSLVALHLACRSLSLGECDLALVGGVNLMLTPEPLIAFCKLRALSPDGRCKTFDSSANGYGRGEGCGMIVLKRLDTAQREGDRVLAVVKGSALNNDGRSNGLTAPNGLAQRRVITAALQNSDLQPGDIDYVEAHGTGTPLGDPIEVEAIASALGQGRDASRPLLIGSAKTNIGHLESAAGIAGIIKLVLALNAERIPPHLHCSSPSSHIAWDRLPLRVVSRGAPWLRSARPRRAGISGFGFSGTNAHVILEEAPPADVAPLSDGRTSHLLVISASDESALLSLSSRFAAYLQSDSLPPLATICNTAVTGRNRFAYALAVAGTTPGEMAEKLTTFAGEGKTAGLYLHSSPAANRSEPVFLFTGQGSQYPGMGRGLYDSAPTYREELDRCDALFATLLGCSIRDMMHSGSEEELARTVYTQSAIFSMEYALARLWQSWGVTPSALLGHSIGEIVAACIAGVLSLEDAVILVAHRGRLMNGLPAGGVMAAVLCPEAQALPVIAPYSGQVSVAAVNAPGTVVISGEQSGVAAALDALKKQGVSSQYLTVSHAFHSHLMDPALDEFERIAAGLTFHVPTIPVISNVTGRPAEGDDLRTAAYWRKHLRGAVRFSDSVAYLKSAGHDLFLEIGANATLSSFVRQVPGEAHCATSLKRGISAWSTMTAALGELFTAGVAIDWKGYDAPYKAGKASIPTYPFQRERYIMNPVRDPSAATGNLSLPDSGLRHPLLGNRLDSPSSEQRFSNLLGLAEESWLAGHTIAASVIMPAAGYLEMALAAAPAGRGVTLEQVQVHTPLLLTEAPRQLQTVFGPDSGSFSVYSKGGDSSWQLHATMTISPQSSLPGSVALEPVPEGETVQRGGADFYTDLAEKGYHYGGVFQSIRSIKMQGSGIFGEVHVPEQTAQRFILHPALLDGCLTLSAAPFLYGDDPLPDTVVFVPATIEALDFSGRSVSCFTVRCIQRERTPVSATFDIFAADKNGEPVLRITGLVLKRIRKELLAPKDATSIAGVMYSMVWREQALQVQEASSAGKYVILTDHSQLSEAVTAAFKISVPGLTEITSDEFLADSEGFIRNLKDSGEAVAGFISLCGNGTEVNRNLVRSLLAAQFFPRLSFVTGGVHDPLGMEREICPEGSALWGFVASVAAEIPEFSCRILDLSPWPGSDELDVLLRELTSGDAEDRVLLRGGRRFVPRLIKSVPPEQDERLHLSSADGFFLDVEQRGSLDGLIIRTTGRRHADCGEVEVQVRAVGLNFRDVLNVLGRYPGDPGRPGFECSGLITGVGSDVEGFAEGDRVFVFNNDGCIADYLTVSRAHVIKIPDLWRFEEAAAIPVAFLTAWYGLHHLAAMQNGDRVLIHAAAGGVGLAAVQLCKAVGAEIFATAGSAEKRELLKQMGVQHIMDSRSLAFADQIREITNARGIDIVLNSLAGEFIDQSISLLAAGGRFIEIGKADTRTDQEIQVLYPSVAYHRFDLAALTELNPQLVSTMFSSLFGQFEQHILQPLPMTVFPMQRAQDAFRFMAQARHIGKVVISLADRIRERSFAERGIVDPSATYVITGGLGALGMAVAGWLVENSCRNLVLVGRTGASAETAESVEQLRQAGVHVCILAGDVAELSDVTAIMTELRANMPPLKGIFHAAGVLDDAMLPELDAERMERVMKPKTAGMWNLHKATERDDLELFVLFSSLTAVTGSPGQANYAAANAALDGFARWRRSRGFAAVSINWGPWSEVGMAAQDGKSDRLTARGIRSISSAAGLHAMAAILRANPIEQCVADLDLQRLASFVTTTGTGLYAELFSHVSDAGRDTNTVAVLIGRLKQVPHAERHAVMLLVIQELAAKVMGQSDPTRIEPDRPLQEQGFDSLMAVDLRNLIAKTFSVELPVSLLFDYPTPDKIGRFLLDGALDWFGTAEPAEAPQVTAMLPDKSADDLVDEIEQLLGG